MAKRSLISIVYLFASTASLVSCLAMGAIIAGLYTRFKMKPGFQIE